MSTIGIWCTVSEAEYKLLRHTMVPLLAHPAVTAAVVVHTGTLSPANAGSLAAAFHKVREIHRDFGQGFHKSIEEGGYDQLAARNFAIEQIEATGVEWLLQFDADEYFDASVISTVSVLDNRYDAVCCSHYTLLSETELWHEPRV